MFDPWGRAHGIEAVVDKDRSAALVAEQLHADALLLLTDVPAIYAAWGTPEARALDEVTPAEIIDLDLPVGSMGAKAGAAARFVERTGGVAAIGALSDAAAVLRGEAGTRVALA